MSDPVKSIDVAKQLQQIGRYEISDEEREQIEIRLDMLDGTRDGVIDRSRETICDDLVKIVRHRVPQGNLLWKDFQDLQGALDRAAAAPAALPNPAPEASPPESSGTALVCDGWDYVFFLLGRLSWEQPMITSACDMYYSLEGK